MKYDILVVGAGLFGAVIAREAVDRGKRVLVVDRRPHIGGNCFTEKRAEINVHAYGAHIFRTSDEQIWNYMSQFFRFNNFINSPIANYKGELYNMPFNMNTFHALWGVRTPAEARAEIDRQRVPCEHPSNLEEHVLNLAGRDIYHKLVKGYTEKQWGSRCVDLPPSIMRRIPLRFTYDNNYFNDRYQGVGEGGYTNGFEALLAGADVRLNTDYLKNRFELDTVAQTVVYTGPIDEFYGYRFGPLGYRGLRFEVEELETSNYQGVAVMNFTDAETPYTRVIEHKHFEFAETPGSVISYEYPVAWHVGDEPYYPMEDADNRNRYDRYAELATTEKRLHFGGRLGAYRYYDMQDTVKAALKSYKEWYGDEGGKIPAR